MAVIQHLPKVIWRRKGFIWLTLMERHQGRNLQAGAETGTVENSCLAPQDLFIFLSYTAQVLVMSLLTVVTTLLPSSYILRAQLHQLSVKNSPTHKSTGHSKGSSPSVRIPLPMWDKLQLTVTGFMCTHDIWFPRGLIPRHHLSQIHKAQL